MESGEELDNIDDNWIQPSRTHLQYAKHEWREAALRAVYAAENLQRAGVHKSIVNRILEPFLHVNVLVTGTTPGWMNFFGLRLDKTAQPEMRVLAEEMWKIWNESQPKKLEPGQWHLPFIDEAIHYDIAEAHNLIQDDQIVQTMIKISVARCARLSYLSFETRKRSTIEEDLKLYDRLVGSSPIHASPAEHQATPDTWFEYERSSLGEYYRNKLSHWEWPMQSGNLGRGWRQYRKMLPNESIAQLPQEYK
jgi:thymidylate synthase ThyX